MIRIHNLTKSFTASKGNRTTVLKEVSFSIKKGTIFTLLGPSGCGKSTTLRSIAGLEKPDSGEIYLDNEIVYSSDKGVFIPPEKRRLGMVFQSYAIWPHMTVGQNVSYALENQKFPKKDIAERVRATLAKVGMDEYIDRLSTHLSGGQQQRVALARALVTQPRVLLLDEPLSNLDAKLREQMRHELKRIQQEYHLTSVYVTHDQEEALALSDQIALMYEGEIVEVGSPVALFEDPKHRFTASFIGISNFVTSKRIDRIKQEGTVVVENPFGRFKARDRASGAQEMMDLSFRPHNITLHLEKPQEDPLNVGKGIVANWLFLGENIEFLLLSGDQKIRIRTHPSFQVSNGDEVYFTLDAERSFVYDKLA